MVDINGRAKVRAALVLAGTLMIGTVVAPSAAGEPCECPVGVELVGDPWVRMIPGSMTAGYLQLRNTSSRDRRVVAASAAIAEVIELHEHVHDDGVMRMREVVGMDLPAGDNLALEPGGLHLMFIGVRRPLVEGERIPVMLEFADGGRLVLQAEARRVVMRDRPAAGSSGVGVPLHPH